MKILIVGPVFFSYAKAIAGELTRRGVVCHAFNELHSDKIVAKILYRLKLHFIFKKKIQQHRQEILKFIEENGITDVLFISPDVISGEFLVEIKRRARAHLYMWDGFANKGSALSVLSSFDTRSSFDMRDCDRYGLNYIPLFAESEYCSTQTQKCYDISFCGTLHSNRPSWVKDLINYSCRNRLNFGMLLYYFSPFLLFIRLALNGFCFQLVGKVSFVPFSKREISDLFRQSKVVIDITHPNQVGLTSRTFEALRSGSKLATNNVHCRILEADFPSRVFLLDRDSLRGPALMNFIESDVAPLSDEQDRFLSVGRFADQLLEILND